MSQVRSLLSAGSLLQRLLTAVALVAVCLPVVVLAPAGGSLVVITLFVIGGAWEWTAFAGRDGAGWRLAYAGLMLGSMLLAGEVTDRWPVLATVLQVALLWWLVAFIWITRYPRRISPTASLVCGFLVLLPAWLSLRALALGEPGGRALLLLLLAIVWAADVGAYAAGHLWGRVKLAPQVSPGKTWEGVFGGLALALLTALAGAAVLGYSAAIAAPLAISVAAISIVGDLTVSMFKRNVGLKDSGRLFPGHGGVLDRVDSITAAAPLFVVEALWCGWLGR